MSSYIPGKEKKSKDSCLVRGFWGDLANSPYIGFGVELENREEFEEYFHHSDIHLKFNSQDITRFNLMKFLFRLEKNENLPFFRFF